MTDVNLDVNELAERMKKEILADVAKGIIPASVRSFEDLHGFVDANAYGGLCEDEASTGLWTAIEGRARKDYRRINEAQGIVNLWLVQGGAACRCDPMHAITGGPWGSCSGMSSNPEALRLITGPDAQVVATVHQGKLSLEEALANARAIRAVPELIKILVDAERLLSFHPDFAQGNSKVHFVVHQMRAVLAAAL